MTPSIAQALALLNVPLVPLILARGLRLDRILFCVYLGLQASVPFLTQDWANAQAVRTGVASSVWALPVMNLFLCLQVHRANLLRTTGARAFTAAMLPFSLIVAASFTVGHELEILKGEIWFSRTLQPALVLLSMAMAMASLIVCWERCERGKAHELLERLFYLGIVLWWLTFFFLLTRMIYSGDRVSVGILQWMVAVHMVWLLGGYVLVFRGRFLEVKAHPSPQLVGRATQTILVLGALALLFWLEALARERGISPYAVETAVAAFLVAVLTLPMLPVGPARALRRLLQRHLYVPEQDFALEVALYLQVMGGQERLEKILGHLQGRLGATGVALYRPDRAGGFRLHLATPMPLAPPLHMDGPAQGHHMEGPDLPAARCIPLEAEEECMGYLMIFEMQEEPSWEDESLLRFWSATLGLLLRELDRKEREQEQERMTLFSQATSFLLHDAKNLAQLLDLVLSNYQRLEEQERLTFMEAALPGLHQARVRARRILEKLEAFHPTQVLVREPLDLREELEETVRELKATLGHGGIGFESHLQAARWTGDPQALRKVMENLVKNAVEATQGHGAIEVSLDRREGGYWIEVSDDGHGVSGEDRPRLFEPLFTTKRGGSGLGLYQAKVLVERMGGRIGYRPNEPKGSLFYVWLDRRADRRG
ncbi:MAG: sensor histidine kinase [Thermodesulfobacteriota bacterium]